MVLKKVIFISFVFLFLANLCWGQEFDLNKIQYQNKHWEYLQSQHFDIYFYQGGEQLAYALGAMQQGAN